MEPCGDAHRERLPAERDEKEMREARSMSSKTL
jgi:hypothetical protein